MLLSPKICPYEKGYLLKSFIPVLSVNVGDAIHPKIEDIDF